MKKIVMTSPSWKSYQKTGFRFLFIFFILFIVFMDWSVNPILSHLYYYGPLSTLLDGIISWIGKDLFQIPYTIISPYDGEHNDRTYMYLLYFTMAVLAILGTVIWSLLDRKRQNYNVPYYWLTVLVRYYLAFTMFLFALYKFFKVQFPDLDYYTLTAQVGDMSPMHLAWAFFGYSYAYNVFMGIAEGAALLLLFRRTTAFGATLMMLTLANVMAINYSYDVHAKLYPTTLFAMALFLCIRDAKSILQFFFLGKAVSLQPIKTPVFSKRWIRISKPIVKVLVVGTFLIMAIKDTMAYWKASEERLLAKSEYSGAYNVETFVIQGDTLAAEHPMRWQQLIIGDGILEAIRFQGDSLAYITITRDKKELIIYGNPKSLAEKMQEIYNEQGIGDEVYYGMDSILIARQNISRFHIKRLDAGTLELEGTLDNDSVHISAQKMPLRLNDFRLLKRQFHWINEASYFY